MRSITAKEVLDLSCCLEEENIEDRFSISYYHFLRFFEERDEITEHDLIISANFTYGWMPTILNFKSDEFGAVVSILNKAKRADRISNIEIILIKRLINNSLVGASKLLHFINPHIYAIWDSRICNFLTGNSHKYKVENLQLFWSYIDLCERILLDPDFENIHEKYINKLGFEVSPMRTIEQIMFINSNKPIRS